MEPDDNTAEDAEVERDMSEIIAQVKAIRSSMEAARLQTANLAVTLSAVVPPNGLVHCHDRLLEAQAWADYAVSSIEQWVERQVGTWEPSEETRIEHE